MKKVGLYFGTFNPIHVGHLIIANYMAEQTDLDQVWLVVSPKNPLKQKSSMLTDVHRLTLTRIAVENNPKLWVSNIEFDLPRPSYTTHTLAALEDKHPNHSFALIMGEDNLRTFHKWKNYESILGRHKIYVYPRVRREGESKTPDQFVGHMNIELVDAPVMNLSSTQVRQFIKDGRDVSYMLTPEVHDYVREMHFYENS